MKSPRYQHLFARLRRWLLAHRPLGWVDGCTTRLDAWRPDPPVMDRLIR